MSGSRPRFATLARQMMRASVSSTKTRWPVTVASELTPNVLCNGIVFGKGDLYPLAEHDVARSVAPLVQDADSARNHDARARVASDRTRDRVAPKGVSRTMGTSNVDARTQTRTTLEVSPHGRVGLSTRVLGATDSAGSFSALKTNGGTAGGLYCSMAAAVPWDYSEFAAPGAVVNSITRV